MGDFIKLNAAPRGLRWCRECPTPTLCDDAVPVGHHAPLIRVVDGQLRRVNCAGKVLR